jgi:hypothetical protein
MRLLITGDGFVVDCTVGIRYQGQEFETMTPAA